MRPVPGAVAGALEATDVVHAARADAVVLVGRLGLGAFVDVDAVAR